MILRREKQCLCQKAMPNLGRRAILKSEAMLRYEERYFDARSSACFKSRCLVLEKSGSEDRSDALVRGAIL